MKTQVFELGHQLGHVLGHRFITGTLLTVQKEEHVHRYDVITGAGLSVDAERCAGRRREK
jgi:hypothetical protein